MFTKFRIQNFRTHKDTTIEPKDLTLIIGSNNSGKTNLLEALSFLSYLVRKGDPKTKDKYFDSDEFYKNEHSLSKESSPIVLNIIYSITEDSFCEYEIILEDPIIIEKFAFKSNDGFNDEISSRTHFKEGFLLQSKIDGNFKSSTLAESFFRKIYRMPYFNFQPSFLKGYTPINTQDFNFINSLGKNGEGLQETLKYLKLNQTESNWYNKFVGYLKSFEESFAGISIEQDQTKWQFKMENKFISFDASKVSDGLMKAAAVALLCVLDFTPPIIMLEEIENGINQRNLTKFIGWLREIAESNRVQFILTSHSPSVIREFSDHLDAVYNVHLKRKKGYISDVTNLNDAIAPLVKFGSIKEEAVYEKDGVYHIRPYELTELFYNGILAEL